VSFRSACDISRACRPICASPISPSISARGTSAATESTDDDVHAVRADEHLDDLERLLAVVGLRDQQAIEIDTEFLRVGGVERVLGVHEGRHAARLLRLRDDLQRQRGLARGLRPEDLDDAAARHAADAERVVDADGAGGDDLDGRHATLLAEPHDRPLAELLFNLANGQLEGLVTFLLVVTFKRHGTPSRAWGIQTPAGPATGRDSKIVPGESQAKVMSNFTCNRLINSGL
jgi:hypothetical protein